MISQNGLELIKKYESLRLNAYLCPANKLTIGYGHVILPKYDYVLFKHMSYDQLSRITDDCQRHRRLSKEAKQLLFITPIQADALLNGDTRQLVHYLDSVTPVPLTQNQFDALCSLIFNIGQGNYARSTLRRLLHDDDYTGAAAEFDRWTYGSVNGIKTKLSGLVKRRSEERQLFESPDDV